MEPIQERSLETILQQQFKLADFRPGQREAIEALLDSQRALCIQPTGYGKSLIYQLSSQLVDGLTLVISPLLALMRDQIDQLNNRFNIPAASINSDQTDEENRLAMHAAIGSRIRILFVAPEKLDNLEIFSFLSQLKFGLIVVDEAHCISTWGHDFRPAYRQIVQAIHRFEQHSSDLHVLGLTATANGRVEQDIAAQLRGTSGRELTVLRRSMDRPNISLSVISTAGMAEKLAVLADLLPRLEGSGILYCATRENTEIVAEYLSEQGLDVVAYHAGYDSDRKRALQRAFMQGRHKAIAATNALGMGIDKADIRFIVHVDVPGSITAYYQEVGRAGRDNLPAQGILLFDEGDRRIQEHFIRSAQPTEDDFETVLREIRRGEAGNWPTQQQVRARSGLHPTLVTVILAELQEQTFVEKQRQGGRQVYIRTARVGAPELTRYSRQFSVRNKELESMLAYGRGQSGCLMQTLRRALGDVQARACGRCSHCRREKVRERPLETDEIRTWLATRKVPIAASRRPPMEAGVALLDGKLRQPLFVNFMRGRTKQEDLDPQLQEMLQRLLRKLAKDHRIGLVLAIPSRTWQQREHVVALATSALQTEAGKEMLQWREMPPNRQGELFNNDQRRDNVKNRMRFAKTNGRAVQLRSGEAILLLDDYIGSGATMMEAVRAIRAEGGIGAAIVPLTIARIRWRLGARGMI